jgi:hypothetical protein
VDPDPDYPDSETLWIRIRIGNPDPDKKFQWDKALFGYLQKKNFTTEKV